MTHFSRASLARHDCHCQSVSSYLSLEVNEESVASARLPVATGRQKPEGNSSELTADDDLDLDLDLDLA